MNATGVGETPRGRKMISAGESPPPLLLLPLVVADANCLKFGERQSKAAWPLGSLSHPREAETQKTLALRRLEQTTGPNVAKTHKLKPPALLMI